MLSGSKVFVAGHRGLAGSALVRRLQTVDCDLITRARSELDLTRQDQVDSFFAIERPDVVFLAAAKVGGIMANKTYPADFIRENLQIQTNVIDAAYRNDCKKLVFLGSSCIYPRLAPQPIIEESLLTGPLESSNKPYAIAKIAGLKMCDAYRQQYGFSAVCLMPCNLYGPGDNFDPDNSHVLAGLMRRIHEAKATGASQVVVWGTGTPVREFLHADDLADAAVFLANIESHDIVVNVGSGTGISIRDLALQISDVIGYEGELVFDTSKPDGTPMKVLDVKRIAELGWTPQIGFEEGLVSAYEWYRSHLQTSQKVEPSHSVATVLV